MRRSLSRRFLSLAWLLGWLAAPAVSLALLVHVTSDHHHDHRRARDLAFAATHGHSHAAAVAGHEHIAVRESAAPALPVLMAAAHIATVAADVDRAARVELSGPPPPTGSPPLFHRHCALLL